jgi:hypothetical protein
MSFQAALILSALIPVSLSSGLAYLLVRRKRPGLAVLLGLALIAAVQVYLQVSVQWAVHRCIERACAGAALAPNCQAAQFGCTEWSGLSALMFLGVGVFDSIVFLVGATIMVVRERRRARSLGNGSARG